MEARRPCPSSNLLPHHSLPPCRTDGSMCKRSLLSSPRLPQCQQCEQWKNVSLWKKSFDFTRQNGSRLVLLVSGVLFCFFCFWLRWTIIWLASDLKHHSDFFFFKNIASTRNVHIFSGVQPASQPAGGAKKFVLQVRWDQLLSWSQQVSRMFFCSTWTTN